MKLLTYMGFPCFASHFEICLTWNFKPSLPHVLGICATQLGLLMKSLIDPFGGSKLGLKLREPNPNGEWGGGVGE